MILEHIKQDCLPVDLKEGGLWKIPVEWMQRVTKSTITKGTRASEMSLHEGFKYN